MSHGPSMSYGWLFNQKPGASPEIIGNQQKWIQRLKSSRKTREAMQPSLGFPSWGQQTQPLRPFFHGHNVKHHHCLHEDPLCLETGPILNGDAAHRIRWSAWPCAARTVWIDTKNGQPFGEKNGSLSFFAAKKWPLISSPVYLRALM